MRSGTVYFTSCSTKQPFKRWPNLRSLSLLHSGTLSRSTQSVHFPCSYSKSCKSIQCTSSDFHLPVFKHFYLRVSKQNMRDGRWCQVLSDLGSRLQTLGFSYNSHTDVCLGILVETWIYLYKIRTLVLNSWCIGFQKPARRIV